MNTSGVAVTTLLILVAAEVAPGYAQTIIAGGAIEVGVERFHADPAPNRLDGSAIGWALVGGVRFGPVVGRVEAWRDAVIEHVDATSLVVNGRTVTVQSALAHDAHAVGALGGYVHDVSSRVQVAGVGGLSYVTFSRTFTTNAGQLILVGPPTVPVGPTTTRRVDRFAAWTIGADVTFRTSDRMRLLAGARSEPLRMTLDISGRSVRLLAGAVWIIR